MAFRYIQDRLSPNGTRESLSTEFPQDSLTIGRGGQSQLILASRQVSLVHARLGFADGRPFIEDQSSLAGVRVNGKRVARSTLANGDIIQLGDVRLAVSLEDDTVILRHEIKVAPKDAEENRISGQRDQLRLDTYLPRIRLWSLFTLIVVTLLYFVVPLTGFDFSSWNSGPISNPHKMIEADCKSCHAVPFEHVQDRECLSCHNMTEHAANNKQLIAHHPEHDRRCGQCHMEHNGDNHMRLKDSRLCTDCHNNLKGLESSVSALDVVSFDSHPQFRISIKDKAGKVTRVPIDDPHAVDSSTIKLNHALHLKPGLRGKNGPVTLQCNSCHELNADFKGLKPIKYEQHCNDCHSLGFDDRIPAVQVPHGDDDAVYPALFTEYTKLLLLKSVEPNELKPQAGFERTLPGGTGVPAPKRETVNAPLVVREARNAEQQLFTKTACFLCHDFNEKPTAEQTETNTHYKIKKPEIPATWFPAAKFGHGAHEGISCESCHDQTRHSSKTTDVLLPKISMCRDCHVQEDKRGFVKSECILCHSYHDSLGFPVEKKKTIAEYLSSVQR